MFHFVESSIWQVFLFFRKLYSLKTIYCDKFYNFIGTNIKVFFSRNWSFRKHDFSFRINKNEYILLRTVTEIHLLFFWCCNSRRGKTLKLVGSIFSFKTISKTFLYMLGFYKIMSIFAHSKKEWFLHSNCLINKCLICLG